MEGVCGVHSIEYYWNALFKGTAGDLKISARREKVVENLIILSFSFLFKAL